MDRRAVTRAAVACLLVIAPVRAAGQRLPAPPPARFTVESDGHPLAVWARIPERPRGVILLLHGRTWSSLPDFDLQVPGWQRSTMQSLADRGFAAYAVDLRGYGGTPRDESGWLTPKRSEQDVIAVVGWLAGRHPGLPPPTLVGWSRGGAIAQMVAQAVPGQLSGIVLYGFVFDPDARFVDPLLPEQPQEAPNTDAAARSDFVSPRITPPVVVDAFVAQALRADPVLADLKGDSQFNALRPSEVTVPTLVLYGDRDPGVLAPTAGKFFARLGTADRQMVVLPGADHAAHLEDTHEAWIAAVVGFVTRPTSGR